MLYDSIIIGAGPGGISAAVELLENGVDKNKILILEKEAEHSFSIKKYYPDNKLVTANYKGFESKAIGNLSFTDCSKDEYIYFMDEIIKKYQLNIKYNEVVHEIDKLEDGTFLVQTDKDYFSKTVVIAIGILGKPKKPDYKIPASLNKKVFFDVSDLKEVSDNDILVVGGGDSAAEYVQYFLKLNNRVALSYRGTEFKRMNKFNLQDTLDAIKNNKITLFMPSNIKEIKDENGKIGVYFVEEQLGVEYFDIIVYALGGTSPKGFLDKIGIHCGNGQPCLQDNFETNLPGLFITGDLGAGPKGGSIIRAFNISKKVADEICQIYLK